MLAVWLGPRIGFVDRPERSHLTAHVTPAVPLGGIGVFLGVHLAASVRGELNAPLLAASSIVLILGLVDDRAGLSPVIRLIVELVAAVLLVSATSSGDFDLLYSIVAIGLVIVAINAVNLYDGLDGLAGLSAVVAAGGLAFLFVGRGLDADAPLALAAALTGFLIFNWHPARVFLGDSGAYVTGLFLAYLILDASAPSVSSTLIAGAALGVFLIDLVASIVRRLATGGRLFVGDRSHLYDQLRNRGYSVPGVSLMSAVAQVLLASLVVGVDMLFVSFVALAIIASALVAILILLNAAGFLRAADQ